MHQIIVLEILLLFFKELWLFGLNIFIYNDFKYKTGMTGQLFKQKPTNMYKVHLLEIHVHIICEKVMADHLTPYKFILNS